LWMLLYKASPAEVGQVIAVTVGIRQIFDAGRGVIDQSMPWQTLNLQSIVQLQQMSLQLAVGLLDYLNSDYFIILFLLLNSRYT